MYRRSLIGNKTVIFLSYMEGVWLTSEMDAHLRTHHGLTGLHPDYLNNTNPRLLNFVF